MNDEYQLLDNQNIIIKIGVSGDIGSFSEEVGLLYIKQERIQHARIEYLINMETVLAALNAGNIDFGVFPVANTNSGLVRPAIEAMGKYQFRLVDEIYFDVRQCLFAKHHMPIAQISKIYSFAPALEQCKKILQHQLSDIPIIDWGDMAKAARDLASGVISDDNAAIIGSKRAAEKYNLTLLAENIQDVAINTTMFVVVTRA